MKFNIRYTSVLLFILFFVSLTFSQKGKHGSLTVSALNTKVNEFTTLSASVAAGTSTISVASSSLNTNSRFTSTLQVGDLIMIYQAQGAIIKTFSTVPGQDSTYGQILNYNNAGNYEFAQVYAIPNSTSIVLDCGLKNSYLTTGKTQIVRVPRLTALTVNAGGEITTDAWTGSIGGILALEVNGNAVINGTVNATAMGFRGGTFLNNGNYGGSRFVDVGGGANEGGEKGEGIAGSVSDYTAIGGQYAMGAPANGGGGGDSHNAGGGGGANGGNIATWVGYGTVNPTYNAFYNLEWAGRASIVSSGGGRGGYCFSNNNLNPLVVPPGSTVTTWGGDGRRKVGGFGGRPLDYSNGQIFFGGGGGAGHVNQVTGSNTGGSGGRGGGLIFIQAYGNISGTGLVVANGANGTTATGPFPGNNSNVNGVDAAGGGGGGGTIMLASTGNASGFTANANGGNGGNQVVVKGTFAVTNTEAEGPGGGGGGGYIAYSNTPPATQNVLGASCGTTNASPMATFPPNGASNGGDGSKDQSVKLFTVTVSNATVCLNSAASLTMNTNAITPSYVWYNTIAGPSQIGTGAVFTTSVFTTPGTYTVYAGICQGTYREPALITVLGTPTIAATSATICGTQTAVLTATGATTYTWSTSQTTSTIAVSPTTTTIYTVVGTSAAGCTAQATSTVASQSLPSVTVTPSSTVICANQTITLNAAGSSGSYTWSTGAGNTPSVGVTAFGIYTATLTNGCGSAVSSITITDGPTVGALLSGSDNTICAGQAVTLTATGNGTFAWSSSTVTTNSVTVNAPGIYTVSCTNVCGSASASFQINIGPQPTVSIVSTQTTFCTGQDASLTAVGAANYVWNSPISGTVSGASFTTNAAGVYTVNGSNQCGNSSAQITITFQISPDISASSDKNVLCPGQSAVLTATNLSGGGGFAWSSSSNTSSVEPISSGGVYTVSYTNGCGIASTTVAVIQSTLIPNFVQSATSGYVPLNVTFTNTSFNYVNSQWTFGNGEISNNQNGTTTYNSPGIYTINLVIQNNDLCLANTTRTIEVMEVPLDIIPQLVSPNSDGKNDKFEIKGLYQFTNNDLQIFNRWGNLVYTMKNYDNSFDGTPNAKGQGSGKLPAGTYYYILNLGDSNNQTFHGYFQLAY